MANNKAVKNDYTKDLIIKLHPELDPKDAAKLASKWSSSINAKAVFKTSYFKNASKEIQNQIKDKVIQLKDLELRLEELQNSLDAAKLAGDTKQVEAFKQQLDTLQKQKDRLEGISENDQVKKSKKEVMKDLSESMKSDFTDKIKDFGKSFMSSFKNVMSDFLLGLDDISTLINDAVSKIQEMVSYNLSDTTTFSQDAVSMYENYGLTGAQAYAMQQALESVGFNDMNQYLSNIQYVNDEMREKMQSIYQISESEYENSLELSKEYQNYQDEMTLLKNELQQSIISFIVDNKDIIKTYFSMMIGMAQGILSFVNFLAGNRQTTSTSDILNLKSSGSTSNTTSTTNLNIDNTFNGISQTDQSWLSRTGQMTYQDIITYLNG